MRYFCLCYDAAGDIAENHPPSADADSIIEELRHSGHLIAAATLHAEGAATFVRVRHGRLSVSDHPVDGQDARVRCFALIDARDLNDAIRIAGSLSAASESVVEVRSAQPPKP